MDGIGEQLDAIWRDADAEARLLKGEHRYAVRNLTRYLERLGPTDRAPAEALLASWVTSDDPRRQFDALVVIDELGMVSALPELRALAARLEQSDQASAPYDWAWVNRIVAKLASQ